MAGYSGTPLPQKLGIKEQHEVAILGAPAGFTAALGTLPAGAKVATKVAAKSTHDVLLVFVKSDYLCSAARAAANTASSIGSVSRPVNVFCWLTW